MAPAENDDHYHPKDALKEGLFGTLILGGGGLVVASIQNALQKRNVGALAVFTRYGGTITTYGTRCSLLPCVSVSAAAVF